MESGVKTLEAFDWAAHRAAVWRPWSGLWRPVTRIDPVRPADLYGLDAQRDALFDNTRRLLEGRGAEHALLWGARGTGKSSLVKAVFNALADTPLRLVQIDDEALDMLPEVFDALAEAPHAFIVFCDDIGFGGEERAARALKRALEGGIECAPDNVRLYATSNRRHLVPEPMADNWAAPRTVDDEIHPGDAVEDRLALADRFGLRLGFYPFSQRQYLALIDHLAPAPDEAARDALHRQALDFARLAGAHSGRVARRFLRRRGAAW